MLFKSQEAKNSTVFVAYPDQAVPFLKSTDNLRGYTYPHFRSNC
jgi:hypothetical protein